MTLNPAEILLYLLTAACGLLAAIGRYWAAKLEIRIDNLESELEREKLQVAGRLARLEALLEKMAQQLDRIERVANERR